VEELRRAGERHSKRIGSNETGFDKAYGLSQALEFVRLGASGRVTKRHPDAGFIRLLKDELRTGIISHEATHMAVAIYKQDVAKTIPDMEREEKLCYLVGDITSSIVNKLYDLEYL